MSFTPEKGAAPEEQHRRGRVLSAGRDSGSGFRGQRSRRDIELWHAGDRRHPGTVRAARTGNVARCRLGASVICGDDPGDRGVLPAAGGWLRASRAVASSGRRASKPGGHAQAVRGPAACRLPGGARTGSSGVLRLGRLRELDEMSDHLQDLTAKTPRPPEGEDES
jgi:hypothetical protein